MWDVFDTLAKSLTILKQEIQSGSESNGTLMPLKAALENTLVLWMATSILHLNFTQSLNTNAAVSSGMEKLQLEVSPWSKLLMIHTKFKMILERKKKRIREQKSFKI